MLVWPPQVLEDALPDAVHLILNEGVDLNAQEGSLWTALRGASYQGHLNIVRLLLDGGADVNARSGEYGIALSSTGG